MAIRPSMTPNQTDEERIEQILKEHREWMRGIRTDRLIGTNSAQAKQALLEIVQEARIDELTSLQHQGSPAESYIPYREVESRINYLLKNKGEMK